MRKITFLVGDISAEWRKSMALRLPAAHQGSGQALQGGADKANVMQIVPLSSTLRLVGNNTWLQL